MSKLLALRAASACMFVIAAEFACPAVVQSAEPASPPQSYGNAVLRIVCDPATGLGNQLLIKNLLSSSAFLEAVMAKIAGDGNAPAPHSNVNISVIDMIPPTTDSPGIHTVFILATVNEGELSAVDVVRAIPQVLERELQRLDSVRAANAEKRALLLNHSQELARQLITASEKYRVQSNQLGVNPDTAEVESAVVLQIIAANVEVAGLAARREALEKRIAMVAIDLDQKLTGDATLKALDAVVKARQEKLAAIQSLNKADAASHADVLDAEAALAQARAEFARHKGSIIELSSGQRLAALNEQLDQTVVSWEEHRTKVRYLEQQVLADVKRSAETHVDLVMLELDIENLKSRYAEARAELGRLETKEVLYRAPVVQLGPSGAK